MASVLLRQGCAAVRCGGAPSHRSAPLRSLYSSRTAAFSAQRQTTALVYREHGQPGSVLRPHSWQLPPLSHDEAVVRMVLSSVNPADINVVQGVYPSVPQRRQLPGIDTPVRVGGNEGVGEVVLLSKNDASGLKLGDWVTFGRPQMGTWCSRMIAPTADLIPVPRDARDKLDEVMASTLMINPATALCMLREIEPLSEGDVVVQNAANSAVGQAVVQIAARKLGVETINFVRDRENLDSLRAEFAQWGEGGPGTHVFTYEALADRNSGVKEQIKEILAGRKIKLGLNALCGKDTRNMVKLLGPSASVVTYGAMSRAPLELPASLLIFNDLRAVGFWMTTWYRRHSREERVALLAELARWYAEGSLRPPASRIVRLGEDCPLEEAGQLIDETMSGSQGVKTFLKFPQ